MILTAKDGREVEIHETEFNIDGSRFFTRAVYMDTGEEVPGDVIDYLNETCADECLNSMWG